MTAPGSGVVLCDLDVTDPAVLADPYPFFARHRERAPVQWHEGMGMYLTFTHATANAVLRARTLGRIWASRWPTVAMPGFDLLHVHSLLEMEPPEHTRLRRLIASAFARGHVERLRPRVAALADQLVDDLVAAGADGSAVDLIAHYAEPLPVQVIAELLGVPRSDRAPLRPWSRAIVGMYEYDVSSVQRAAAEQAAQEFIAYLRALIARRRRVPETDLISGLIAETDADGARLIEDELVTTCILLLNAGHEASVNTLGNAVLALSAHPEQWTRLGHDRSLVATAVEEFIRYDAPLQLFERTAVTDTVVGEVTVRAGQKIAALLGAANRDPTVFPEPDVLDVGRSENPHLGFGAGIHFCVGAPLARVELQASVATLLDRLPGLHVVGNVPDHERFVMRGVARLPVRW